MRSGFRVQALGFLVQGSAIGIKGLGFKAWGAVWSWGAGLVRRRQQDLGWGPLRVQGSGFGGFKVVEPGI